MQVREEPLTPVRTAQNTHLFSINQYKLSTLHKMVLITEEWHVQ